MKDVVSDIVYLRTYARYNEDERRRETWEEIAQRVSDWSASLAPIVDDEKESLRNLWASKKALPAGRSLWVGGTEYSKKFGLGNFNCSFTTVRCPKDFYDIMFLLMSGAGVGFSARRADVERLNQTIPLYKIAEVKIDPYNYVGAPGQLEHTVVEVSENTVRIIVGDSRQGWSEAVEAFMENINKKDVIEINLNYLRPIGTPLKTFGGFASGPEPLNELFREIPKILSRSPVGLWSSTKILDIVNLIGRCVVAGGSRRSAQIALGDAGDTEFEEAKIGDWYNHYPWRSQSNNSVVYTEKPDRQTLFENVSRALQYGEPGIINGEQALKRKVGWQGINPCAEILLRSKGLCNLTTINLMSFIDNGTLNLEALKKAIYLQARHNLRVTLLNLELDEWDKVQKEDRLLGMSFTGFGDLVDALSLSTHDIIRLFSFMRSYAKSAASEYAKELGVNPPELVTTVKPEGTGSQVLGVSSGIHPNFGPYYIRRIRINEHDSVAQALIYLGFPYERDVFNKDVLVFEFPIATPAKKYAYDYNAVEMLNRYKYSMKHYTDHNTSITVYIEEGEVDDVVDWLLENWDSYVAVSFLRKDNNVYPQQPYEAITEQQYKDKMAKMPSWDRRVLDEIERTGFNAGDLEEECATGVCPVR